MISRSKKLTDTEKRLQALKSQLYGKESEISPSSRQINSTTFNFKSSGSTKDITVTSAKSTIDISYLKHDLIKIFILTAFAITIQVIIYLAINRNLLKF